MNINKAVIKIAYCSLILLLAVAIGFLIMLGLYSLPVDEMMNHASQTKNIYSTNGGFSNWANDASTMLDTYTDSVMISIALSSPYESKVENAMRNSFFVADTHTANEPQGNLLSQLEGEKGHYGHYENYWHGYLLLLKPLLLFFNIAEIRVVMMFIQLSLIIITEILLHRKDKLYPLAFAPVVFFINPITTILSFQFADIFIIALLLMDYLLLFNDRVHEKNRYEYLFLISGIMVAFFDFFTYPLVAFGLPAILMLMMNKPNYKDSILSLIKCGISWVLGYAGMWLGKWIIAYLTTGANSLGQAIHSVLYRSNISGYTYLSVLQVIKSAINLKTLAMISIIILLVWILGVVKLIRRKGKIRFAPLLFSLLTGLLPFLWYFVVRNHSILHPWMEYREMAVSIWAISAAGTLFIKDDCALEEGETVND